MPIPVDRREFLKLGLVAAPAHLFLCSLAVPCHKRCRRLYLQRSLDRGCRAGRIDFLRVNADVIWPGAGQVWQGACVLKMRLAMGVARPRAAVIAIAAVVMWMGAIPAAARQSSPEQPDKYALEHLLVTVKR
jgi:hypothetical protein